jgi:hypothetical protein
MRVIRVDEKGTHCHDMGTASYLGNDGWIMPHDGFLNNPGAKNTFDDAFMNKFLLDCNVTFSIEARQFGRGSGSAWRTIYADIPE